MFVESTLIAYTDTVVVPSGCMRPDLVDRAAAVQFPVPCDIEMIADIGESLPKPLGSRSRCPLSGIR